MAQLPDRPRTSLLTTLLIATAVCIIAVGATLATLGYIHQQKAVSSSAGFAATSTTQVGTGSGDTASATQTAVAASITPEPPPNLPPAPTNADIPPLGARFVIESQPAVSPTPCPSPQLPAGTATTDATPSPSAGTPPATCNNGRYKAHAVCTVFPGTNPTQDDVRQAMYTIAQQYSMPFPLVEAVGWQESGWTLKIQACDGGTGIMQLQPETTAWLNNLYHTSYDPTDLNGNVTLGVRMIKWLYDYYIPFCNQGLAKGQTCDWDTVWPGATDGATVRQIVLSAYNQGIGNVAHYGILNWGYVNSTMALWRQFKAAAA